MCDGHERHSLKALAERVSEQTSRINYSFIQPNSTWWERAEAGGWRLEASERHLFFTSL
jgi:hypothetical protein